LIHKIEG